MRGWLDLLMRKKCGSGAVGIGSKNEEQERSTRDGYDDARCWAPLRRPN